MFLSNASAYAVRALCRLDLMQKMHDGRAMGIQKICDGTQLPEAFVAKIFQDLVRAGLLSSLRGRSGGFSLAKATDEIFLIDLVSVIDGLSHLKGCASGLNECDASQPCPLHDKVMPIREQVIEWLENTSLADMSEALDRKLEILSQFDAPAPGCLPSEPSGVLASQTGLSISAGKGKAKLK